MIVRESIGDILKPKSPEDVRKNFRGVIFWKGVIDGKVSPDGMRYFLDKNFLTKRTREIGFNWDNSKFVEKWRRQLVYYIDLITEQKTLHPDDDLTRELHNLVWNTNLSFDDGAALYIGIRSAVERAYKSHNVNFKRRMGTNLRND